jgi:hypothetical protein
MFASHQRQLQTELGAILDPTGGNDDQNQSSNPQSICLAVTRSIE